jgi:hypothetical protein
MRSKESRRLITCFEDLAATPLVGAKGLLRQFFDRHRAIWPGPQGFGLIGADGEGKDVAGCIQASGVWVCVLRRGPRPHRWL